MVFFVILDVHRLTRYNVDTKIAWNIIIALEMKFAASFETVINGQPASSNLIDFHD